MWWFFQLFLAACAVGFVDGLVYGFYMACTDESD